MATPFPDSGDPVSGKSSKLSRPASVLFLCNYNVIRSPMAEALTRAHFGKLIYTASAGVRAGEVDPFVAVVMDEIGLDTQSHQPQCLDDLNEGYFDLIVTLSPTAHHIALELSHVAAPEVEYWPSADPTAVRGSREQMLEAYRDVRDRLLARILDRFGPSQAVRQG
jgi:protein-tyrosine-phosphatase